MKIMKNYENVEMLVARGNFEIGQSIFVIFKNLFEVTLYEERNVRHVYACMCV